MDREPISRTRISSALTQRKKITAGFCTRRRGRPAPAINSSRSEPCAHSVYRSSPTGRRRDLKSSNSSRRITDCLRIFAPIMALSFEWATKIVVRPSLILLPQFEKPIIHFYRGPDGLLKAGCISARPKQAYSRSEWNVRFFRYSG